MNVAPISPSAAYAPVQRSVPVVSSDAAGSGSTNDAQNEPTSRAKAHGVVRKLGTGHYKPAVEAKLAARFGTAPGDTTPADTTPAIDTPVVSEPTGETKIDAETTGDIDTADAAFTAADAVADLGDAQHTAAATFTSGYTISGFTVHDRTLGLQVDTAA